VQPVDLDHVMYPNSIQINQNYRQVYASSSDFELAERTCREHPEVCDPERPRFGETIAYNRDKALEA
jgi:hypothetical protein